MLLLFQSALAVESPFHHVSAEVLPTGEMPDHLLAEAVVAVTARGD